MDKIDAIEVLQQLRPIEPRGMDAKTLRTRVNVARAVPHTGAQFDDLLSQLKGQGLVDSRLDVFRQPSVWITEAGLNVLQSAGV